MGWKFPEDVVGWLSEPEGRKLAELARGRRVLEIGSYAGRSTVCMAQTAASVACIDPCDGRATPLKSDLEEVFLSNLRAYGVRDKVRLHIGTTAEVAPDLPDGSFDLIFIDGDHSASAVRTDIDHALRLLAPGGLLAFHDYQSASDPAVSVAVNNLVASGSELCEVCDTVAVVRPGTRRSAGKPVVALSMPRRGNACSFGAGQGFHLWPTLGACEVVRAYSMSSLLDHTFNRLWAGALNLRQHGVTHFAMIHDDIAPGQGWLDILLQELARTGADIVSAVVPIKSPEGTTSTAVETDDPWFPRRLTLQEVYDLPETFTETDVGGKLLLNSGLWVCDIRRPWVDTPKPLCFQTLNRLVRDAEGDLVAEVRSEDWEFSRAARARGAKLYATRKVSLVHEGEMGFPNDHPWGTWQTDEIHRNKEKMVCA